MTFEAKIAKVPGGGRFLGAWLAQCGRLGALRFGSTLFAVSLLAGCVVGPDYKSPSIELPASGGDEKPIETSRGAGLRQWWRRFNDPILNALIGEAVERNLDVAAAKARIRQARASRREAVGALFPSVSGSGSASRSRDNSSLSGGLEGSGSNIYNEFKAGFDASWEPDFFGANHRAVEASAYAVDASEDDLELTLLTLIGDIAASYAEARGYQARIALARRTAASQRRTAALTQRKFVAGTVSGVDVAKALAQAASTEATVPGFEASLAQDVHRLGILLGRDPDAAVERMQREIPIPMPRLPLPRGIPANVLSARPDVRKAERQFAQYTAKIGQAEAALYPSLSLTGSVATTALKIGDLSKNSSIGWSFGPTLSVPIFNGGQLRAEVEVAQAQRDQYYIAWRSAVLSALEDVENTTVMLAREQIKLERLSEAARRYRESARLAGSLYEIGSSSFLDVLDAERSQYSAEDSVLQSRVAIAANYIALAKALGGGWDGEVDSSKPEIIDSDAGPHWFGGKSR